MKHFWIRRESLRNISEYTLNISVSRKSVEVFDCPGCPGVTETSGGPTGTSGTGDFAVGVSGKELWFTFMFVYVPHRVRVMSTFSFSDNP